MPRGLPPSRPPSGPSRPLRRPRGRRPARRRPHGGGRRGPRRDVRGRLRGPFRRCRGDRGSKEDHAQHARGNEDRVHVGLHLERPLGPGAPRRRHRPAARGEGPKVQLRAGLGQHLHLHLPVHEQREVVGAADGLQGAEKPLVPPVDLQLAPLPCDSHAGLGVAPQRAHGQLVLLDGGLEQRSRGRALDRYVARASAGQSLHGDVEARLQVRQHQGPAEDRDAAVVGGGVAGRRPQRSGHGCRLRQLSGRRGRGLRNCGRRRRRQGLDGRRRGARLARLRRGAGLRPGAGGRADHRRGSTLGWLLVLQQVPGGGAAVVGRRHALVPSRSGARAGKENAEEHHGDGNDDQHGCGRG
mmetsp:Transcript_23489/g.62779  ORF Transcript_23489/g.62779 Transcript_23489/m.62779 type:complete len:355 (+) Transcript_23489:367-1431(+)